MKTLSISTIALMAGFLGLAEGSSESEVQQALLDKKALGDADAAAPSGTPSSATPPPLPATAADEDKAPDPTQGTTEDRIAALAGDRIASLNAEVKKAQTLASERLGEMAAKDREISALKAKVESLEASPVEPTAGASDVTKNEVAKPKSYLSDPTTMKARAMLARRKRSAE